MTPTLATIGSVSELLVLVGSALLYLACFVVPLAGVAALVRLLL